MWHALWSYRLFQTDHAGKWSLPNHPYMQPPHLRDGKPLIRWSGIKSITQKSLHHVEVTLGQRRPKRLVLVAHYVRGELPVSYFWRLIWLLIYPHLLQEDLKKRWGARGSQEASRGPDVAPLHLPRPRVKVSISWVSLSSGGEPTASPPLLGFPVSYEETWRGGCDPPLWAW